jgi:hypothetical protein
MLFEVDPAGLLRQVSPEQELELRATRNLRVLATQQIDVAWTEEEQQQFEIQRLHEQQAEAAEAQRVAAEASARAVRISALKDKLGLTDDEIDALRGVVAP